MKPELSRDAIRRIAEFLASEDAGASSQTIALIAMGARRGVFDAPYDTSDFGRCVRLIEAVPELREYFPLVASRVRHFAPILKEWDSLVAAYRRDKPTNRSAEVYDRIRAMRDAIWSQQRAARDRRNKAKHAARRRRKSGAKRAA